jgi:hypothetical protein
MMEACASFGRDFGRKRKKTREGLMHGCYQVGSGMRWVCLPTLWLARREDKISTRFAPIKLCLGLLFLQDSMAIKAL